MHRHAYTYRRKIDDELARIARLKELQVRAMVPCNPFHYYKGPRPIPLYSLPCKSLQLQGIETGSLVVLQVRAIGFLGTVVVGAMIGIFNLLSQLVYSDIKGE